MELSDNQWRIELWDMQHGDKPPFETKQVSTSDPKREAVELLAVTFGEDPRVIRRDLKWQSDR